MAEPRFFPFRLLRGHFSTSRKFLTDAGSSRAVRIRPPSPFSFLSLSARFFCFPSPVGWFGAPMILFFFSPLSPLECLSIDGNRPEEPLPLSTSMFPASRAGLLPPSTLSTPVLSPFIFVSWFPAPGRWGFLVVWTPNGLTEVCFRRNGKLPFCSVPEVFSLSVCRCFFSLATTRFFLLFEVRT